MLVVLGVVTGFTYHEVSQNEREQRLAAAARAAAMVTDLFAAGVTAPLSFGDEPGIREHVTLLRANANVVGGAVWAADPSHPGKLGERLAESTSPDFVASPPGAIPSDVQVERTADAIVVDKPVVGGAGEVLGLVRVAVSLRRENAAIAAAKSRTLGTALALALGLGVVLLALTRTLIVGRLARLADAAKHLERGDAVGIAIDTNDEVGRLARAFGSMTDAIASREADISARNRDLRRVLDNVAEGLLTVTKDGRMSDERSRVLDDWFGAPSAGQDFFSYVEGFAPETARWLRIGWTALEDDLMPVEAVLDQIPHRFELRGRFFDLEFLPIWEDNENEILEEVLVVVSEATSHVERERAEQAQREGMNVFRRILDDRAGFAEFYRESERLVDAIAAGCSGPVDAQRVARDVHTLKGNTGLYGIDSIAEICHGIEARLHEEGGVPMADEVAKLRTAWSRIGVLCDELGRSIAHDRIDLGNDEYLELLGDLEARLPGDPLTVAVRNWGNELASHRLQRIAAQGRSLARRLGKSHATVETSAVPATLRLPSEKWAPLWAVFSHVLRNTFDHGVETADERRSAGKPLASRVHLSLSASLEGVELLISDDGRGIDWSSIRRRAAMLELAHASPADLEEALYYDGISSADRMTEISGRGIGMGAVRDAVRACGGRIDVESAPGAGTTVRMSFPPEMRESSVRPTSSSRRPMVA